MKFAWGLIACAVLALVTVRAECSAYELGFARADVKALQQVAFDQLASAGVVTAAATPASSKPAAQVRCVQGR